MSTKERLDVALVARGLAETRAKAQASIMSGIVYVNGQKVDKAGTPVAADAVLEVRGHTLRYVSRGGLKLEKAMAAFPITLTDCICADIGASTGGFTDCLLQRGARHVTAVDAGEGQLAPKLRLDARVTSIEHCNARNLTVSDVGDRADLIVLDVSFISQTYILPRVPELLRAHGVYIGLVKPQFEAGKSAVGKGGIVKDPSDRLFAARRVFDCGVSLGLVPVGFIPSPIKGGDGNREYLICFRNDNQVPAMSADALAGAIKQKEN